MSAQVKASKSSKSSKVKSSKTDNPKIPSVLPDGVVAKLKLINWDEVRGIPSSRFKFTNEAEESVNVSSTTDFFENQFSPFASKKITIGDKTTIYEDNKRVSFTQQLKANSESERLINQLLGYDAITTANHELFLGNKLASHYELKSSVRITKPKMDPKKPDKDLTEKQSVKFMLKAHNEFWYDGELLSDENVTNIYKSKNDYYKNHKETDKENKKYNKLKILLELKNKDDSSREEEVYLKDIADKKKIDTIMFYREKNSNKIPRDANGELMTPNKCIQKGGNKELTRIYGDASNIGKPIGYAADLDNYLDTSKGGKIFIRYQYLPEKVDVGKNPNDSNKYEIVYTLIKIDVIKIISEGGLSGRYNSSYTSFMSPSEIENTEEANDEPSKESTKVDEAADNKSKSSDNNSYKKALLTEPKKKTVEQNSDADKNDSDSDSNSDSDSDSNSDSEDDNENKKDDDENKKDDSDSDDDKDAVVPQDSDKQNINNIKESISDSESDVEAKDNADANSDSNSDSDSDSDSDDSETEREKEEARQRELKEQAEREKKAKKAEKAGKESKNKKSKDKKEK